MDKKKRLRKFLLWALGVAVLFAVGGALIISFSAEKKFVRYVVHFSSFILGLVLFFWLKKVGYFEMKTNDGQG